MAYSVYWHVPNRVFVIEIWAQINILELSNCANIATELIRQGQAPVHCIGDARNARSIPRNLRELQNTVRIFQEPNLGRINLLTNDILINFFATSLSRLSAIEQMSFKSPEQLIANLQRYDPTLPELPPYMGTYADLIRKT